MVKRIQQRSGEESYTRSLIYTVLEELYEDKEFYEKLNKNTSEDCLADPTDNMPKSFWWKLVSKLNDSIFSKLGFAVSPKEWLDDRSAKYNVLFYLNNFKRLSARVMKYAMSEPDNLDNLYKMLSDEKSRETFEWYIKYLIAANLTNIYVAERLYPYPIRNEKYYSMLSGKIIKKEESGYNVSGYIIDSDYSMISATWVNRQYFLKGVCEPKAGDTVIDAGSYCGETAIWFAGLVGESGTVYSFEPSKANLYRFKKNVRTNWLDNIIHIIEKGIWDKDKKAGLLGQSYGAMCCEEAGDLEIDVTALDTFIEENKVNKVDIIKMDVEGAELKALKGAADTIRKFKPILAICVYHKPEDLMEIPAFIKALVPEYKLYLSHKCNYWEETILFAKLN